MKILLAIYHHMDKDLGAPRATWNLGQEYKTNSHGVSYSSSEFFTNQDDSSLSFSYTDEPINNQLSALHFLLRSRRFDKLRYKPATA
jgi:hypothetical protein